MNDEGPLRWWEYVGLVTVMALVVALVWLNVVKAGG